MNAREDTTWTIESAAFDRAGFTLIELLVVVSIVTLLLAMLLPAIQRARLHAKSVACQGHLHQCGLDYWTAAVEAHNGFGNLLDRAKEPCLWHRQTNPILCPTAARVLWDTDEQARLKGAWLSQGGKYAAYGTRWLEPNVPGRCGSYGNNAWVVYDPMMHGTGDKFSLLRRYWPYSRAEGRADVPLLSDARLAGAYAEPYDPPPSEDDAWATDFDMAVYSIDRHQGGINILFCDSSVRKVGLKELWTLKWHQTFNTADKWTRPGGVQPEDWPLWMRRFRDY